MTTIEQAFNEAPKLPSGPCWEYKAQRGWSLSPSSQWEEVVYDSDGAEESLGVHKIHGVKRAVWRCTDGRIRAR